jgi:DNA-binding transcriptional ArsR family regulator
VAQYSSTLDVLFDALADPTRRAVIRRLGTGSASVGELAGDFAMTLPSFLRHIRALEGSGLIRTRKRGRVRTCTLERDRLAVIDGWLAEQRAIWESRTDRLEQHLRNGKDNQ